MSTQPEAKQVPLVERLESVPVDARLAVDDGPYSTSFYAVGAMAHEAAAELRRLSAVEKQRDELLEALRECLPYVRETLLNTGSMDAYYTETKASVAIKKAEGEV